MAELEGGGGAAAVVVTAALMSEVETDTGRGHGNEADLGVPSLLDADDFEFDDTEVFHDRVR